MGPAVFLTQLGRVTTPMGAVACMARPPSPASRVSQAHAQSVVTLFTSSRPSDGRALNARLGVQASCVVCAGTCPEPQLQSWLPAALVRCCTSLVTSSALRHMACIHQLRAAGLRRAAAGARQMASQGLDAFSQSGLYSNHMARPPAAPALPARRRWACHIGAFGSLGQFTGTWRRAAARLAASQRHAAEPLCSGRRTCGSALAASCARWLSSSHRTGPRSPRHAAGWPAGACPSLPCFLCQVLV
jgi:hypothetical protein